MNSIFPQTIRNLPEVTIPFEGVTGYVVQGKKEQVVFMEFKKDTAVREHTHESQWEIVLEGTVDYWEDGKKHTYKKGTDSSLKQEIDIRHTSMPDIVA